VDLRLAPPLIPGPAVRRHPAPFRKVALVTDQPPIPARVRRDRMLALLRERDFVRVADLAERFEVSEVTVRGDLDALADRGQLRRVRGGAVPRSAAPAERPFEEAEVAAAEQKRAIARAAAQMVGSGDSIVLDVGTTTTAIAQALAARDDLTDVTVFTSFPDDRPRPGGRHPTAHRGGHRWDPAPEAALVGRATGRSRPRVDPRRDRVRRLQRGRPRRRHHQREPARDRDQAHDPAASQRRVVCADGSKLGRVSLAHVCDLDDIDLLITDVDADPELVQSLRETGLEVVLAERGGNGG